MAGLKPGRKVVPSKIQASSLHKHRHKEATTRNGKMMSSSVCFDSSWKLFTNRFYSQRVSCPRPRQATKICRIAMQPKLSFKDSPLVSKNIANDQSQRSMLKRKQLQPDSSTGDLSTFLEAASSPLGTRQSCLVQKGQARLRTLLRASTACVFPGARGRI